MSTENPFDPSPTSELPEAQIVSTPVMEAQAKAFRDEQSRNSPKRKEPEIVVPQISTAKQKILARIGSILAEFDNMESNIAYNHVYWELVKQARGMK